MDGRKWLTLVMGALTLIPLSLSGKEDGGAEPSSVLAEVDERAVAAVREFGGRVEFDDEGPVRTVVGVSIAFPGFGCKKGVLAQLSRFPRLKRLALQGFCIGDKDLNCLDRMRDLEVLNLFQTDIGDDGLKHLIGLDNLRELRLGFCYSVHDEGMRCVGNRRRLEVLDLGDTKVSDEGLKEVGKLTNLRELVLTETNVSDRGVERLTGLKKLEDVELRVNDSISDKALDHLLKLPNIRRIEVDQTGVTDEGVAAFKKRRPEVGVWNH